MKAMAILQVLLEELERHYISPQIPQTLYLSRVDQIEFENSMVEAGKMNLMNRVSISSGEGWSQPKYKDFLEVSMGNYYFRIFTSEKSSLIYTSIKEKIQ